MTRMEHGREDRTAWTRQDRRGTMFSALKRSGMTRERTLCKRLCWERTAAAGLGAPAEAVAQTVMQHTGTALIDHVRLNIIARRLS